MALISLLDFEGSYLNPFTADKLMTLQVVLEKSKQVLWISKNNRTTNPEANMMTGLARTLQFELPHLTFRTLDVEDDDATPQELGNQITTLFLRSLLETTQGTPQQVLWTAEPELMYQDGSLMIPRIVQDDELNDRLNSSRRPILRSVDSKSEPVEVKLDRTSETFSLHSPDKDKISTSLSVPNAVVIQVKLSSLHAVRILRGSYLFVCLGNIVSTGRPVIALSRSNASIIRVPLSWTVECPQLNDEIRSGFLAAFVSRIIANTILEQLSPTGVAMVHEATPFLRGLLLTQTERGGTKFAFTSETDSDTHQPPALIIHPEACERNIRRFIHRDVGFLFDLSIKGTFVKVVSKSLDTIQVRSSSWFFRHKSQVLTSFNETNTASLFSNLEELLSFDIAGSSSHHDLLSITDLPSMKPAITKVNTLISWDVEVPVQVAIRPFDATTLFSHNKTYLLIGLTGELGQSLAQYMIFNGAQHIVLASRNPQVSSEWIHEMEMEGAIIKVSRLDLTNRKSLEGLVEEIRRTLPPIAGVANGAMVLSDKAFSDMTFDQMNSVLEPKVSGTRYINELFQENTLDFFILFSSLASVVGNRGQSNYNTANMFMLSTARQRRIQGLAASVLSIGMIIGLGYVSRMGKATEKPLRKLNFMPISEREFHTMFKEAIVNGRSGSPDDSDIIVGLQETMDATDDVEQPPWFSNPRFSHLVNKGVQILDIDNRSRVLAPVADQLNGVSNHDIAVGILQLNFLSKLGLMVQEDPELINVNTPLTSLGIDSLIAVEIRTWFLKEMKMDFPIFKILGQATVAILCAETIAVRMVDCAPSIDVQVANELSNPPAPASENNSDFSGLSVESRSVSGGESTSTSLSVAETSPKSPLSESSDFLSSSFVEGLPKLGFAYTSELSSGQKTLWLLRSYLKNKSTHNIVVQYTLRGDLNRPKLENSIIKVIQRHDILRTSFYTDQLTKKPLQGVVSQSSFAMRHLELPNDSDVDSEFNSIRDTVFNLENAHAFDVCLISRSSNVHDIIFAAHHIIMDGVSWNVLMYDIHQAYTRGSLPPLSAQYSEFVEDEASMLTSGALDTQLAYWISEFTVLPEPLALLPVSKVGSRQVLESYDTGTVTLNLNDDIVLRVRQASKRLNSTPFHFYLAALQVLLSRLASQEDVCIGMVDANRSNSDFNESIGYFINTLPLRFSINENDSFDKILGNTRKKVYAAMENSQVPIDVLLEKLKVPRSPTHSPLFQVLVNYRLGALEQKVLGDCAMTDAKSSVSMTPYDLTLLILETSDGGCLLQFDTQNYLYSAEDSSHLLQIYSRILDNFSRDSCLSAKQCNFYNEAAANPKRLDVGRGPSQALNISKTLINQIDEHTSISPESIALVDSTGCHKTYESLQATSSAIASIIESLSKSHLTVGLLMEPSADAICAMVAILRVGARCVPLDLSNPVARLKAILNDCRPDIVLYHASTSEVCLALDVKNCFTYDISTIEQYSGQAVTNLARPEQDAFVLYTSGTTGMPKGIRLTHRNLSNSIIGIGNFLKLGKETVLQQSSMGFDLSIAQIFLGLSNGGKVIIAPREHRGDAIALSNLMLKHHVTFTFCVPSEYSILLRYGTTALQKCHKWRVALSAGERMTGRIKWLFSQLPVPVALFNGYGPAETTIVSHIGEVLYDESHSDKGEEYQSAGKSLMNVTTRILDAEGALVPIGFPGEICIGGASVAAGYTSSQEDVADKFGPDPYSINGNGSDRLYRSGDRGRLLHDGTLIPLGRMLGESQVKINGIRVELEGIANTILTTSKGDLAEVVVIQKGEIGSLVGFVTFAKHDPERNEREYLGALVQQLQLPEYMRPKILVSLDVLPRTPNGKVDTASLKELPIRAIAIPDDHTLPPLSPSEERLSHVWRKVLREEENDVLSITKYSDFFRLGGNSLLAVELQAAVRVEFGVLLDLRVFFHSTSLHSMTTKITAGDEHTDEEIDWEAETSLGQAFGQELTPTTSSVATSAPNRVLLTGAFGFLGKAILQDLVRNELVTDVYCVAIRQPKGVEPRRSPITSSKIHVYPGDLSLPRFGLSESDFNTISQSITTIIHNGAEVSFMKNYRSLSTVNVGSTKEVLKFSLPNRAHIHFISTGGVADLLGPGIELLETTVPSSLTPDSVTGITGYVASKWAGERLLCNAAEQMGSRVWIHRPMYIIGEDAPMTDLVNAILAFSIKMKLVPDLSHWNGSFDLVAVRNVAADVVLAAVSDDSRDGGIFVKHESGDFMVPCSGLKEHILNEYGADCGLVSFEKWISAAEGIGLPSLLVNYLREIVDYEVTLPRLSHS
jgi:amino acid adenylation domain-containing protein/thioester reductase-like protein